MDANTGPHRNIVVFGAGTVVTECYLPALAALQLTGQLRVLDPRPPVLDLAPRYPAAEFVCGDYRTVLAESKLERFSMAIVALPNALHEEAVRFALSRSMHVLCEKPLTLSSAACRSLAAEARQADRILAVNMVRRHYPSVKLAGMAVRRGLLGELQLLEVEHGSADGWVTQTLAPFQKENGGVLADMGVHYLDLAELLVGELSPKHYRDDARCGVEAEAEFELEAGQGTRVRIALSRLRSLKNHVSIVGSDGRIEFHVDSLDRCKLVLNGERAIELKADRPFAAGDFEPTFAACFAEQVHEFLENTRARICSFVDAETAARTVSHIEWAYSKRRSSSTAGSSRPSLQHDRELEPAPALVTGATGFIGSHLIEKLTDCGFDQVTAAVRGPRNCAQIARMPVDLQMVDLLDSERVRAALRGKRYVFHLAYGRDGIRRSQVTVDGTRNIVEGAIAEMCEVVVILSTIYVFGQPDGLADETFPYHPMGGEYGRSKAKMERWCLDRAKDSGRTRIVVLNPTCVYGPRGSTYSELPVRLARHGGFCWIENGIGIANYTYVGNLVDAILKGASVPAAHGERFIINDGSATWREFLEPILSPWAATIPSYTKSELIRLHKEADRRTMAKAARSLVRSGDLRNLARATKTGRFIAPILRRYAPGHYAPASTDGGIRPVSGNAGAEPPVPVEWLADLFGVWHTRFSSEKAHRLLSWKPVVSLAEGQERTRESVTAMA